MNTAVQHPPEVRMAFGQVRHTRLLPRRHAFVYDTYFLMLPMRQLRTGQGAGRLAINQRAALSFFDTDHGDGRGPERGGALAWVEEVWQQHGIDDVDGEVWLHTFPRVWGHTFKPVSFWYGHRRDGSLRVVMAEVNNTFGERHCYLLDAPRYGQELRAEKCFHVSPFCSVSGTYRFRLLRTGDGIGDRTVVRVDLDDEQGLLLSTSISGTLHAMDDTARRRALWGHPAMTWMLVWRIHWHALRLWLKRVRWYRQPPAPEHFVTR